MALAGFAKFRVSSGADAELISQFETFAWPTVISAGCAGFDAQARFVVSHRQAEQAACADRLAALTLHWTVSGKADPIISAKGRTSKPRSACTERITVCAAGLFTGVANTREVLSTAILCRSTATAFVHIARG